MSRTVIALGTNIGERNKNLEMALSAIEKLQRINILSRSSVYETKPWGVVNQPDFLNMVILVETNMPPHMLLGELLGIESAMGRIRTLKYGPRIIDLDIISYDNIRIHDEFLTLPHPLATSRDFVMKPLSDIDTNGKIKEFLIESGSSI
ncbi:MAG: 2-amino-4-hydroxy-6-hydroxymethyldihydropteridine diphosphokinase [Clostridiales bacterium]|nr:2-amino-4-hydroxy-6-hydroxymethyldihydropteridine diphosphokinase [Clostridiales bacterium]